MDNILKFEEKLKELYNKSLFLTNNEEIEIPENKINEITKSVLNYSRLKVLKKIKSDIKFNDTQSMTFGKLLETLRISSKLTFDSIAELINSKISFIKDLENNNLNPLSLSVSMISNILNIFNITLKEFIDTSNNYLIILNRPDKKVMTRYTGNLKDKNKNVNSAIDSALIEINKQENKTQDMNINPKYIDQIKKELITLKRLDLIQ